MTMRKLLLIMTIALCPFIGADAQNNAKYYLPEQGDVAFGIDVKPMFKYIGNIFNGSSDNDLDYLGGEPVSAKEFKSEILPEVSIMGKCMVSDSWAIRANVGVLLKTDMERAYVQDDKNAMLNPFDESKLLDKKNTSKNGMSLMLGTECRKGSDRIQGVLGMGLLFGVISEKITYDYANAVTSVNQQPSSAWPSGPYRPLCVRAVNGVFYGVTGSVGVEWFVAPKVSVGTEVNLSLYGINGGQEYLESEGYNTSTKKVEVRTDLTSPGNNKLCLGTESLGGSLYMAFYF